MTTNKLTPNEQDERIERLGLRKLSKETLMLMLVDLEQGLAGEAIPVSPPPERTTALLPPNPIPVVACPRCGHIEDGAAGEAIPVSPTITACTNCGTSGDGGYETYDGNVGPFCSTCWGNLNEYFVGNGYFDEDSGTHVRRHLIISAGKTMEEADAALASAVRLTAATWPPRQDPSPVSPTPDWHPIETHDGGAEPVLTAEHGGGVVESWFSAEHQVWWELNSCNDGSPGSDRRVSPTHWMKLPASPTAVLSPKHEEKDE